MKDNRRSGPAAFSSSWLLVLSLVGVDYFSTLAYLPSIAVAAAGAWAPFAAGGVVLVTFLLAVPVYWYVIGRAPDGRGAAGLLEDSTPGWRGKVAVLTLLGFAAADFVITRSLSVADATVHLIHNSHGRQLLQQLPVDLVAQSASEWPLLELLLRRVTDPPVATTLLLSLAFFGLWQFLKRGLSQKVLYVTAAVVCCYLSLTALVIVSALVYLVRHPEFTNAWWQSVSRPDDSLRGDPGNWACLSIVLWSFPQLALGLSGFEMIMTVVPQVRESPGDVDKDAGRTRNTRKVMFVATLIMAVYLMSAVFVTTTLVPPAALAPGGPAQHRALAYLAHGSPFINGIEGRTINPLFGHHFGDLFDFSSALILCLAGATVTLGLQNLLPHYLNRLGMEVSWAGKVGAIIFVLNLIVLLVTVVFRASPSSQQWAYATSVLVLLAGASFATAKDLSRRRLNHSWRRSAGAVLATLAGVFFVAMTGLTVLINPSGLAIAMSFVMGILVCSIVSRWIRSTELRFEGFEFADAATSLRWNELCQGGPHLLVPHRPGRVSLAEKYAALGRDFRLSPATPVIFIEAMLGDPSNFYQRPLIKIEREEGLEVIRVSQCVSVSHVLASIALEFCRGGTPPEIIFGWSHESPLAANLNFLLLGEGNIPWMVKELIRKALPASARLPRVVIG